ncbi:ribosomal RNA small subunit methyltransferase A [Candidatus Uhrbacteria bacterium]|nr:ribosomal RNA small subunit methyltransferase A [Candidatus Uhrbacteria bacterium]
MASPLQILKQHGIDPKRSRGQNFLVDQNIVRKIIAQADIQASDTIVEIGSGSGILTEQLAQKAGKVYAIEIDKTLIPLLADLQMKHPNVEIIQQDIRTLPLHVIPSLSRDPVSGSPVQPSRMARQTHDFSYRVVANIPYNITSLLIRKFLEEKPRPSDMILMVQKEVAQRICAKPPRMNLLAAITQYYGEVRIFFMVARTCFYPAPKVDSAVIRIVLDASRDSDSDEATMYTRVVKTGFAAPRKLLISNLVKGLGIPRVTIEAAFARLGIALTSRAQELSVQQWIDLALLSTVHCKERVL